MWLQGKLCDTIGAGFDKTVSCLSTFCCIWSDIWCLRLYGRRLTCLSLLLWMKPENAGKTLIWTQTREISTWWTWSSRRRSIKSTTTSTRCKTQLESHAADDIQRRVFHLHLLVYRCACQRVSTALSRRITCSSWCSQEQRVPLLTPCRWSLPWHVRSCVCLLL